MIVMVSRIPVVRHILSDKAPLVLETSVSGDCNVVVSLAINDNGDGR